MAEGVELRSGAAWMLGAAVMLASFPASATYSVVAADTATGEVGGAGTSCLSGHDVYVIYGSVPGLGVVHAQATYAAAIREHAVELLSQGRTPSAILEAITAKGSDADSALRQYGIVSVRGEARGFTGTGTMPYAGDAQGAIGGFVYSVQGNILTSNRVIEQASRGFTGGGCDLAERLLLSLEAGAENDEGDRRCTPQGIPSDSAFLQVERPGVPRAGFLALRVPTSDGKNPLPLLRQAFAAWRLQHPCPVSIPPPAQSTASPDSGCGCHVVAPRAPSRGGAFLLGAVAAALIRRRSATGLGLSRRGVWTTYPPHPRAWHRGSAFLLWRRSRKARQGEPSHQADARLRRH